MEVNRNSVYWPTGLSRVWSYTEEIPQFVTISKILREVKVAYEELIWEDVTQGTYHQVHQNVTKRLRTCVDAAGGHIAHKY